jgi:hypothetical protein
MSELRVIHVSNGFLKWAIKPSLLAYISRLDDAGVDLSGGTSGSVSDGFRFPIAERVLSSPDGDGVIRAEGTVVLRGHGMVICEISDPHLEITEGRGVLSIRRWPNREARLETGIFDPGVYELNDIGWEWSDVRLLGSGREAFDYRYDEGADLAEIGIVQA